MKRKKEKKTCIGVDGYRRFSNSGILVHRFVAEKILGRPLKKGETVHHKNRIKSDNRRSNLWVFGSQWDHYKAHRKDLKRTGNW
jgi:hypothetical protein